MSSEKITEILEDLDLCNSTDEDENEPESGSEKGLVRGMEAPQDNTMVPGGSGEIAGSGQI